MLGAKVFSWLRAVVPNLLESRKMILEYVFIFILKGKKGMNISIYFKIGIVCVYGF